MEEVELIQKESHDMQGLIVMGYKQLTAAAYLLLEIKEEFKAKTYLEYLASGPYITTWADKLPEPDKPQEDPKNKAQEKQKKIPQAIHIAFTIRGLKKLGLSKDIYTTFSREFTEGMHDHFRSKILGDVLDNKPDNWNWGNMDTPVDMILLLYAERQESLETLIIEQRRLFEKNGISLIRTLDTYSNWAERDKNPVEHFGFHDGISNPSIDGITKNSFLDTKTTPKDEPPIKKGEFVLGYKNEYDVLPDSPTVPLSEDPENILPVSPNKDFKDFGKNGTYLVFREITQDVFKFWNHLKNTSREEGNTPEEKAIRLGAKMIGRWPGGAPVVDSNFDDPKKATVNSFTYEADEFGHKCPFGSHIRRTFPRDQLHSGRSPKQSKEMTRKHRILRRGRIFGKPLVESMKPEDMLRVEKDDGGYRGIHFICLVANIRRQFEFIQNVWANNFTFADLCNEVDPLIAPRPLKSEPKCNEFTVQDPELRRNYRDIPQFTRVVGGSYFFMPGIAALKFLAKYKAATNSNSTQLTITSAADTGVPITFPTLTAMHKLEIGKEYWDRAKEEEIVREIMRFLSQSLKDQYGTKKYFRRFHARSLGLMKAVFKVSDQIPVQYRVGLFETSRTYDAWVRFSLGSQTDTGDHRRGLKGMSIKILDVDTAPIESNEFGNTQDMLLTNNKIIFPGTPAKQLLAMKSIFAKSFLLKIKYGFKSIFPIRGFLRFLWSLMNTQNCLKATYFSGTPYQFGQGRAVKWKVEPVKPSNARASDIPRRGEKDFVRQTLQKDILNHDYSFDVFIQPQEDPKKQPIENGAVVWKTNFIKVATLTLPKQDFNTPERLSLEESIVFNPWNCMPEHQPLGGINRVRGPLYASLSKERAEHNKKRDLDTNAERQQVVKVKDHQTPGVM